MDVKTCDFLVIGGGVIGVSTALELSNVFSDSRIVLIDKEPELGLHASGRNSGVLHAGFYYSSDSLKARFTREGNAALRSLCKERSIPLNQCGKLVVAQDQAEDKVLDTLLERGKLNNIELEVLSSKEAREIEPRVKTFQRALYSPTTATVDPVSVLHALVSKAKDNGVNFEHNCRYIERNGHSVVTSQGTIEAKYVVNSAGLYADKVAADFGFAEKYYLLPFKGIYLYGSSSAPPVRTNIYPVPDLNKPFLGVHFTLAASGQVKIGPTAIPAMWPEQYGLIENFSINEFLLTGGRHMRLALSGDSMFRRLAIEEIKKYSRHYLVSQAKKLMDGVEVRHFKQWGRAGIRAQLINKNTQKLEMDFILEGDDQSMHILNAVSPAFTCSLPFAKHVVEKISQKIK